jgi:hypothetical protein
LCHHQGVCCILVLLALVGPRFVLLVLWLLTTYLNRAFDNFLLPFLGFLFLPWTTLAYAIAHNELILGERGFGGLSELGLIVVLVGFLIDVGVLGGGARRRYAS